MSPNATGFFAGTLVWTRDGRKPIEEVCVGDWVLSFPEDQVPPSRDRETDEFTYVQVNRIVLTENVPVSEVNVLNFASNHSELLKVASDQRFFAKRYGWTPAKDLTYRHVLFAENFGNLAVGEVVGSAGLARVHGMELESACTCYVGILGVWIHCSNR